MALLLALNTAIAAEQEETVTIDIPEPTRFVSEHSGRFNGERIDYQAVAGETYIRDLEGRAQSIHFHFCLHQDKPDGRRSETCHFYMEWRTRLILNLVTYG
jgi:hypothetical protein